MKTTADTGFSNRTDAGSQLGERVAARLGEQDCVVLGLPRGGVPVAAGVARALGRPFDVLIVRKLGLPGHEEVAMGAIASGGVCILNDDLVAELRIGRDAVDAVVRRERAELERRERLYRGERPPCEVAGRTVVVVDDGLATGATMSAALRLLRERGARRLVVAVPVAPPDTVQRLLGEADEVITVIQPQPFIAVGRWYGDFTQVTDTEVRGLLVFADPEPPNVIPLRGNTPPATQLQRVVRRAARPLGGTAADYDELMDWIGDCPIVLLGESTHGTHEFYRERALITRRLIEEKDFNAVAAEADWPDAWRVNRFVRGEPGDSDSTGALAGFARFPAWMWRNADVLDFVGWLRDHNERVPTSSAQAGFYGLDLYSLHKSMDAVIDYLHRTDPRECARARVLYGCIDRFGRDPQNYGLLAGSGTVESCREEVAAVLSALSDKRVALLEKDGAAAIDEHFFAIQNARLVRNAEEYYRGMFRSDVSSWNLRDHHMIETLIELVAHLQSQHGRAKVVVWAHNSHVGDARATDMARRGECNIGELAREAFPGRSKTIGFTTFTGSVTAAEGWHLPAARRTLRPGIEGSYEHLFHQVGIPRFWLDLGAGDAACRALDERRLERAVGVVYQPSTERRSHYFHASLTAQFDAVIHIDVTRAVEPLERTREWCTDEAPETFPAGL
jgi:erythromycin esterase-like protein/predicted phosphoribosyltransferase